MRKALVAACVCAGCLISAPVLLPAQQIIHALTGTVSAIDPAAKTITVFQDTGSAGVYQQWTDSKTRIAFDKHVQAASTAASQFDKQGAYVIVFYFGGDSDRTAVALKSLGAGPFQSTQGTVTHYDGRAHAITVQDESGKTQTFKIDDKTVAETMMGVTDGSGYHADKGDHVRIVSSIGEGDPIALFVRDL